MHYNAKSSHNADSDRDEVHQDLIAATENYLADGLRSDLLRAMTAAKVGDSPAIQVRVDEEQSEALANSLRDLVKEPSSVYVTDPSGKRVALTGVVSHEDLAEMVCSRGFKLHIIPENDYAGFAAQLASATSGNVIVPGHKPLSARSITDSMMRSLESGDETMLLDMSKTLRNSGIKDFNPMSLGFISTIENDALQMNHKAAPCATRFAGLIEGWNEWRTQEDTPTCDHEVAISASNKHQPRRVVIISATSTLNADSSTSADGSDTGIPNDLYQTLYQAKASHFRASTALANGNRDPASSESVAYEKASHDLDCLDPDGHLESRLSFEQRVAIVQLSLDVANDHIKADAEDIRTANVGAGVTSSVSDESMSELTAQEGMDIMDIITKAAHRYVPAPSDSES